MRKELERKLRDKKLKVAPVDQETSELIKELAKLTDEYPSDIIKAAILMLSKSLGHQVVLRDPDSDWELIINGFRSYKSKYKLNPGSNERSR